MWSLGLVGVPIGVHPTGVCPPLSSPKSIGTCSSTRRSWKRSWNTEQAKPNLKMYGWKIISLRQTASIQASKKCGTIPRSPWGSRESLPHWLVLRSKRVRTLLTMIRPTPISFPLCMRKNESGPLWRCIFLFCGMMNTLISSLLKVFFELCSA